MDFEFDEKKSRANATKHGIDFTEAQAIWSDERRVEADARTTDEPRSLVIGKIGGVCWSAVVTNRNARIRLISVRRSRAEEVALYEG